MQYLKQFVLIHSPTVHGDIGADEAGDGDAHTDSLRDSILFFIAPARLVEIRECRSNLVVWIIKGTNRNE